MGQVKIYGLQSHLSEKRLALSNAIHNAVMEAFSYPTEKRFHRFILLESENFIFPADRSENYTILEISIFEGRSIATKKKLIRLLYEQIHQAVGIAPQDLEITIFETPKCNWGIRGLPADELKLNYKVEL